MEHEQVLFSLPLPRLEPIMKKWMREVLSEKTSVSFDEDERLTRQEICDLYKISLPTVHALMKRGLPYEKVGRKTLFRRADVDKFFREKRPKVK